MYNGRRDFRAERWQVVLIIVLTAIFAGVSYGLYKSQGSTWMTMTMAAITVVYGGGGIIEILISRIELTDDALIMTDLRGRRSYAITDIRDVGEAKGSPTIIRLHNGKRIKLPGVGSSVGNSIRAWLKQA